MMIRKMLLNLGLFCLAASNTFAQEYAIPENFNVTERYLAWTSTFDIQTSNFRLGTVNRKFLSLRLEYDFYDYQENLKAKGKMRWISFGAVFDVTDQLDNPIGMVEERIFTFFPTFDIFAPSGEKLASAKMNFWGTRYTLTDPMTNKEMAVLSRPFLRLRSDWSVNITDPVLFNSKQINPALFITVMAFQTDREHWERQKDEFERALDELQFNSMSSLENDQENEQEQKLAIHSLRKELEAYRTAVQGIEPSMEDLANLEAFVELHLGDQDTDDESMFEETRIISGIKLLLPYLESEELTLSEKSGLFLHISSLLSSIE